MWIFICVYANLLTFANWRMCMRVNFTPYTNVSLLHLQISISIHANFYHVKIFFFFFLYAKSVEFAYVRVSEIKSYWLDLMLFIHGTLALC